MLKTGAKINVLKIINARIEVKAKLKFNLSPQLFSFPDTVVAEVWATAASTTGRLTSMAPTQTRAAQ